MGHVKTMTPFFMLAGGRAEGVSLIARLSVWMFGSPNVRRANGIISTRFDIVGSVKRMMLKVFGIEKKVPVFALDRVGVPCSESLPRIWLSERVSNTKKDDGIRVFVETYPTVPDFGGRIALELGDRYLGEGSNMRTSLPDAERLECFKAAEILYLHALRRGSRIAVARLRQLYEDDLCRGQYWMPYIEGRAKHAKRRTCLPQARL